MVTKEPKELGATIMRLEILNIMRASCFVSDLPNGVVDIKGKNAAGKTSCLDAIAMVLGGARLCPPEPIQRGKDEAIIRAKIGPVDIAGSQENLIAERTFWRKGDGYGSHIEIKLADGAVAPEPQHVLNSLFVNTAFDPVAFMHKSPKEQAKVIQAIFGLDTEAIDVKYGSIYKARTDVNRRVKAEKHRLAEMPQWNPDAPAEPVSPDELQKELAKAKEVNNKNRINCMQLPASSEQLQRYTETAEQQGRRVAELRAELAEAEKVHETLKQRVNDYTEEHKQLAERIKAIEDIDEQPIIDKLADLANVNQSVQSNANYKEQRAVIETVEAESKDLTDKLNRLDEQRKREVGKAKFPIKGLEYDPASGLMFNDLPIQQASHAEQLRVAVAIGQLQNKRLKVLLVKQGSLMDENTERVLAEEAARLGGQVIVEKVLTNGDQAGLIIEEGVLRGNDPEEEAERIKMTQEAEKTLATKVEGTM